MGVFRSAPTFSVLLIYSTGTVYVKRNKLQIIHTYCRKIWRTKKKIVFIAFNRQSRAPGTSTGITSLNPASPRAPLASQRLQNWSQAL